MGLRARRVPRRARVLRSRARRRIRRIRRLRGREALRDDGELALRKCRSLGRGARPKRAVPRAKRCTGAAPLRASFIRRSRLARAPSLALGRSADKAAAALALQLHLRGVQRDAGCGLMPDERRQQGVLLTRDHLRARVDAEGVAVVSRSAVHRRGGSCARGARGPLLGQRRAPTPLLERRCTLVGPLTVRSGVRLDGGRALARPSAADGLAIAERLRLSNSRWHLAPGPTQDNPSAALASSRAAEASHFGYRPVGGTRRAPPRTSGLIGFGRLKPSPQKISAILRIARAVAFTTPRSLRRTNI